MSEWGSIVLGRGINLEKANVLKIIIIIILGVLRLN